ncbi:olfactory receptor 1019-like [Xenopus tropicalis]|uniref:Olfactory receptor n=1 Tax=Xenopus tropicalis TaxID=8364 RepID=A0A8J1IVM9_XENTR|nr:olfactory receptor 1019-like [Xenopus tropicalis]
MENQTIVYVLVLAGLSDLPSLQLPLFLVFLLIYLITLTGNLLILLLIFTDSHLHTPMYFFLATLACLDMGYSSTTVPRMLFDLLSDIRVISVPACITQFYFFLFFDVSEMFVLSVMSYDRYIAICRPLHYMQIMTWKVCFQCVLGLLIFCAVYSLMHTLFLTKLTFCSSVVLQSFFCDLPQLLEASCSDTFINVLLIFLCGILFGVEHRNHVCEVLKRLRENNLYAKLEKCTFEVSSIQFLGFIITSKGLEMDPASLTQKRAADKSRREAPQYKVALAFIEPVTMHHCRGMFPTLKNKSPKQEPKRWWAYQEGISEEIYCLATSPNEHILQCITVYLQLVTPPWLEFSPLLKQQRRTSAFPITESTSLVFRISQSHS